MKNQLNRLRNVDDEYHLMCMFGSFCRNNNCKFQHSEEDLLDIDTNTECRWSEFKNRECIRDDCMKSGMELFALVIPSYDKEKSYIICGCIACEELNLFFTKNSHSNCNQKSVTMIGVHLEDVLSQYY